MKAFQPKLYHREISTRYPATYRPILAIVLEHMLFYLEKIASLPIYYKINIDCNKQN